MGCDIHSVAQVKKNGKWITVLQDVAGDDRSYNTFGALANVRNGVGFAGIETGAGIEPLDMPRGLPEDFEIGDDAIHPIQKGTPSGNLMEWADAKYREQRFNEFREATEVWMGDHSHSHASLPELKAHVELLRSRTTTQYGVVDEASYLALKADGETPTNYSGDIMGPGIVRFTQREYDMLARNGKLPTGKRIYVRMEWTNNQLQSTYLEKIVESLSQVAKKHNVSDGDVRYVFGFDS